MKPITYWVQNEAIDQLVKEYGSTLEMLPVHKRRILIAWLADERYILPHDYDIDQTSALLESLTRNQKDLLIEAIAHSVVCSSNPWIETALDMVAIQQSHVCEK